MSDAFDDLFAEESNLPITEGDEALSTLKKWKMLIVDDDDEVHKVTKFVLEGFCFEGRGLEILDAYSASEAKTVLDEHSDIAMILLDVVMENEYSGLELAKHIREERQNKMVRIVLRTGQAGEAPEKDIIHNYDINDYKEKTELTAKKLYTSVISSLRSYRDLVLVDIGRSGLKRILDFSLLIFREKRVEDLLADSVATLKDLLEGVSQLENYSVTCHFATYGRGARAPERSRDHEKLVEEGFLDCARAELALGASKTGKWVAKPPFYCYPVLTEQHAHVLCIVTNLPLTSIMLDLVGFFCASVHVSLLNVELHRRITNLNNILEEKVNVKTHELVSKNESLVNLIDQKKSLVRVLYHDLNNTLAIIMGASRRALMAPDALDEKSRRLWEKVDRASVIQLEIMEQVRDIDSIQSGKKKLNIQPTSLLNVVEKAHFIFKDKLAEKNLTFTTQFMGQDDFEVHVEPVSFSNNVFNNLISNAIKFSSRGGSIAVRVYRCESGDTCVEIKDEGIGMPADILADLFREDKKTTRPGTHGERGTGFGMPLVKTYMDYYQARIAVSSKSLDLHPQGHGTSFHLYFRSEPV